MMNEKKKHPDFTTVAVDASTALGGVACTSSHRPSHHRRCLPLSRPLPSTQLSASL
jgi:hypothetical protein